jgi:hypothetical protein
MNIIAILFLEKKRIIVQKIVTLIAKALLKSIQTMRHFVNILTNKKPCF